MDLYIILDPCAHAGVAESELTSFAFRTGHAIRIELMLRANIEEFVPGRKSNDFHDPLGCRFRVGVLR